MALGDIHIHFTWQAWHKLTSTFVLRGRRGTYGIGWRAWSGFVACDAAALCVAGVAFGDIHIHFTWQAWHKLTSNLAGVAQTHIHLGFAWQAWHLWHWVTSTFISRGRRGTNSHPTSFCVAGVPLMAYLRFAWQAWHLCD